MTQTDETLEPGKHGGCSQQQHNPKDQVEEITDVTAGQPAPTEAANWIAVVASVVIGLHLMFVGLFNTPPNPLKDQAGRALSAWGYAFPFFQQSWQLFAPNPGSYNIDFRARAMLADGTETDWVDLREEHLQRQTHNLLPPRTLHLYFDVVNDLLVTVDGINSIVSNEQNPIDPAKETKVFLKPEVLSKIAQDQRATYENNLQNVRNLAAMDFRKRLGKEVKSVQLEITSKSVVQWEFRNEPEEVKKDLADQFTETSPWLSVQGEN